MERKILLSWVPLIIISILSSCSHSSSDNHNRKKPGIDNVALQIIKPFANKSQQRGLSHSLIYSHRKQSDCMPECPQVDVWTYMYKPSGSEKIIESSKPISTKKVYWKSPLEARIISISLFGDNPEYYNGLLEFLKSFELIKTKNKIKSWIFDSFTFRVYFARKKNRGNNLDAIN